ncbi:MAG: hypothetical protein ACXWL5_04490 [Candidatus Chromulinivorax sp.]
MNENKLINTEIYSDGTKKETTWYGKNTTWFPDGRICIQEPKSAMQQNYDYIEAEIYTKPFNNLSAIGHYIYKTDHEKINVIYQADGICHIESNEIKETYQKIKVRKYTGLLSRIFPEYETVTKITKESKISGDHNFQKPITITLEEKYFPDKNPIILLAQQYIKKEGSK